MDRLTVRLPNGVINRSDVMWESVLRRLAVYEDTGKMPDEVESLKAENASLCAELDAAKVDMNLVAALLMTHHKIPMCEICKGRENPNDYCGQLCSMLKIESQFTWRGATENGGQNEQG